MAYHLELVIGTTSKLIEVMMRSATTGQPLTGLAVGAVTVSYHRDGAAAAEALGAPAVLATLGTWETDAWKETAVAGLYQYGVPDACLAAGATGVTLVFTGTAAITAKYRIVLTVVNMQDGVRGGMTALPNATAGGNSGLPLKAAANNWLDVANLPQVAPGGTDGLFIAGTNAATVITTSLTTGAITLTTPIQANIAGVKTTALPAESVGGYDAAALGKLLDVASPVLTCASVNQSADNNTILASGTYGLEYIAGQLVDLSDGDHGLSALKTLLATTGIKVLSIANDAITAASINTGAFTADAFAADAIVAATFATGALTADAFAADALVAATFATGALTADAFAANALVAATFAASSLNGKGDWNTVVPDAAGVVASALTVIKGATWAAETDTLEAIRDKLPANLEDLSIVETTGTVKATDEDGNSLATKQSRLPR